MMVGVIVPAKVVEVAVADGTARCKELRRRFNPQNAVRDYVQGLLETYPVVPTSGPLPHASTVKPLVTVEDAAKLIIATLEPEHQSLIRQLAKDSQRPLAAYVISPMLLAKENGQASVVIGEWADKGPFDTKIPTPDTSQCEYCGGTFTPMRDGQRFCPPPPDESDSCGRKWNLDKIHKLRDAGVVANAIGTSPFAPKPSVRVAEHAAFMDALNAQ